jgi:hypothetical protein
VVLVTASWPMWRGGFNPPARFLVPLVGPLALGLGAALRPGFGPAAALLAGWSLCVGLAGVARPELVHRDRDFGAPLARVHSGAFEWTALLPGWVLAEDAPAAPRLSLLWGGVLVAACLPLLRRRADPARMAAASGAAVAAAVAAATLASAPPTARDSVRGRWVETSWGPDRVPAGTVYEPHRYPAGAVIADRLPLPPGRYTLHLDAEQVGEAPALVVRSEPPQPDRRIRVGEPFEVGAGTRAVSLLLDGGGPLRLVRVTLRRETQP